MATTKTRDKRYRMIQTFMLRDPHTRTNGLNDNPVKGGLPRPRKFDRNAKFTRYSSTPPRLPSGASARPAEDSGLFNPLIHGNRNPGRYGTRKKYLKYKGPSRGR